MNVRKFAVVLLGISFAVPGYSWDASENHIRLQGSMKGQLTDSVYVQLKEQLRYRESDGYFFYRYTEFTTGWNVTSNWTATADYRYFTRRTPGMEWESWPMYHVNLYGRTRIPHLELKSMWRLTHVPYEGRKDLTEFNPKFTLLPAEGVTDWQLRPFAAVEMMYDFEQTLFYLYRLEGGLACKPWEKLSVKCFVTQQRFRTEGSSWTETYFTGLAAGLSF